MAPWWPRICEWAILTQPWCWAVLRIECMLRERSKGYRCGFAFWQYCFVFVLVVVEQRFVLLPTFGLVLFQLRKPSLIAIFHLILKSWHKKHIKIMWFFFFPSFSLLWFERRCNLDRSNLFNVLMLNWKNCYLIKNNTLNHLFVTKKRTTKSL